MSFMMNRHFILWPSFALLLLGCLTLIAEEEPVEPNKDAEYRRLLVGVWEDDYQGKRTMTVYEDGTGTMLVELSGLKARLFASRLRFDMVWAIEEGRLKKKTVGGEPSGKVRMILRTMGNQVDEPILELTETRLLLLDANGKTQYDWRRVRGASEKPASKEVETKSDGSR
jgi:hypothetical protein